MTLIEKVRNYIGAGGPQLYAGAYEARIDRILSEMSALEILELISEVLGELP